MTKVIEFIPSLPMGGAETLVKDYVLNLDKSKFLPIVLCEKKTGAPYEQLIKDAEIRVVFLNDFTKRKPKNRLEKFLMQKKTCLLLKKFLKKEKPDVLHVHLKLLQYVKFAKPSCKIFYTVHNEPDKIFANKKEENAAKWLLRKRDFIFITLHERMKNQIDKLFGINSSLILNNGINFERFNVSVDKTKFKNQLEIPENSFVVGHIGRFVEQKNHFFLVDIFNEIHRLKANAFLLMIGDGELKSQVSEKLNSLGLKNNYLILSNRTDIPELMKIMDVFVFPSKFEGLGIVLIEAQKSRLKCIASEEVPPAAKVSNLVKFKSLSDSAKSWADEALNFTVQKPEYYGIENWDMKNVIKKLEGFYMKNSLTYLTPPHKIICSKYSCSCISRDGAEFTSVKIQKEAAA